jgi:hypothetical protein
MNVHRSPLSENTTSRPDTSEVFGCDCSPVSLAVLSSPGARAGANVVVESEETGSRTEGVVWVFFSCPSWAMIIPLAFAGGGGAGVSGRLRSPFRTAPAAANPIRNNFSVYPAMPFPRMSRLILTFFSRSVYSKSSFGERAQAHLAERYKAPGGRVIEPL